MFEQNHVRLFGVLRELQTNQKITLIETIAQMEIEDFRSNAKEWFINYSDDMSEDEVLERWFMPFIEDYLHAILDHTQQYFYDYLYDLSGIDNVKKSHELFSFSNFTYT